VSARPVVIVFALSVCHVSFFCAERSIARETVLDSFDVGPMTVVADFANTSNFETLTGLDTSHVAGGVRSLGANINVVNLDDAVTASVIPASETSDGVFEIRFAPSFSYGGAGVSLNGGDSAVALPADLYTDQNAFAITFETLPAPASLVIIFDEGFHQYFSPVVSVANPGTTVIQYQSFTEEFSDTPVDLGVFGRLSSLYVRLFDVPDVPVELVYRISDIRTVYIPEPDSLLLAIFGVVMASGVVSARRPSRKRRWPA
jgi:hypothetical protein